MVSFVGAGPGAADLITLRGLRRIEAAGCIIYAGSLVNPALLADAKADCEIHNSAEMTLEEVVAVIEDAHRRGLAIVRLHTGDPSVYGAIREQMDALRARGIPFEVIPGVSSFCGAAAALEAEYTLPGISQSVVITRMAGRTPVPERESIRAFAAHRCSMAIFLSAGMLEALSRELIEGGYPPETPAALVYKASWPEEKIVHTTLAELSEAGRLSGIRKTALVLVGDFLGDRYDRSQLYHPDFSTEYRQAKGGMEG